MRRGYYPALGILIAAATLCSPAIFPETARADSAQAPQTQAPAQSTQLSGSNRSKNIKFEDDVVEGMNKNPMDSAENLGRHDGGDGSHLYHKPTDFRAAVNQTVHEMGQDMGRTQ